MLTSNPSLFLLPRLLSFYSFTNMSLVTDRLATSSNPNPTFLLAKGLGNASTNATAKPANAKSSFRAGGGTTESSSGLGKKRPLDFTAGKGSTKNKQPKLSLRSGLSDPLRSGVVKDKKEEVEDETDKEEARMKEEIASIKVQLHKSKEKTDYWRRRSLDLSSTLIAKKANTKKSISALEEKVEEMTAARLKLQKKLAEDTETNEKALDELAGLLEVQSELEKDKERLLEDIKELKSSCAEDREQRAAQIEELQTCLRDTLGDLKTKLSELTTAKEALRRAEARVVELQKAAESSKTEVDPAANSELRHKCDRREERIAHLTGMVEKLVFKASVLSQTNTELKAKIGGGVSEASSPAADLASNVPLPVPNKMAILEEMCLKRYSKIMKQAAGRVYEAKHGSAAAKGETAEK